MMNTNMMTMMMIYRYDSYIFIVLLQVTQNNFLLTLSSLSFPFSFIFFLRLSFLFSFSLSFIFSFSLSFLSFFLFRFFFHLNLICIKVSFVSCIYFILFKQDYSQTFLTPYYDEYKYDDYDDDIQV